MALDGPVDAPEMTDGTAAPGRLSARHAGVCRTGRPSTGVPHPWGVLAGRGYIVIALRRANAALPWMPRVFPPRPGPRAVPPARLPVEQARPFAERNHGIQEDPSRAARAVSPADAGYAWTGRTHGGT